MQLLAHGLEKQFQSSRPVRDATAIDPKVPREVTVSILASRERRDRHAGFSAFNYLLFQSSRPVRDATGDDGDDGDGGGVSILASRERRDWVMKTVPLAIGLFQSSRPVRDATGYWA